MWLRVCVCVCVCVGEVLLLGRECVEVIRVCDGDEMWCVGAMVMKCGVCWCELQRDICVRMRESDVVCRCKLDLRYIR